MCASSHWSSVTSRSCYGWRSNAFDATSHAGTTATHRAARSYLAARAIYPPGAATKVATGIASEFGNVPSFHMLSVEWMMRRGLLSPPTQQPLHLTPPSLTLPLHGSLGGYLGSRDGIMPPIGSLLLGSLATLNGLVYMSVGHISEAKSVSTWACVDVACNLD